MVIRGNSTLLGTFLISSQSPNGNADILSCVSCRLRNDSFLPFWIMFGRFRNRQAKVSTAFLSIRPLCSRVVAGSSAPSPSKPLQPHAFSSFDVSFIGSGSSNPSRFRGMPCMTLVLGGDHWMFDAGEGTVRQSTFGRSCVDVAKIFITNMNADHIFGLPSIILHTDTRFGPTVPGEKPLHIYGPPGLYEYVCTSLRLSENTVKRHVVIHELMVRDCDLACIADSYGVGPWTKSASSYIDNKGLHNVKEIPNVSLEKIYSTDGLWDLVDDPRISVKCGLVRHRLPCFGYIVQETDKGGELLSSICKEKSVGVAHFPVLKMGMDVTLADGTIIRAADVTGPPVKGRKLVYIGDTGDASNIIEAARDCDLLVHDATGLDPRKVAGTRRSHVRPVVAADMALKCNAKKLILNHVSSQFLPIRATFHKYVNQDIRLDWELLDEARKTLPRPDDMMVARDFMTVQVPAGGYAPQSNLPTPNFYIEASIPMLGANNYVDSTTRRATYQDASHGVRASTPPPSYSKRVPHSSGKSDSNPYNGPVLNPPVKPVSNPSMKPNSYPSTKPAFSRKDDRKIEKESDYTVTHPAHQHISKPRIRREQEESERNVVTPLRIRDQKHHFNSANMDIWDFNYARPVQVQRTGPSRAPSHRSNRPS